MCLYMCYNLSVYIAGDTAGIVGDNVDNEIVKVKVDEYISVVIVCIINT